MFRRPTGLNPPARAPLQKASRRPDNHLARRNALRYNGPGSHNTVMTKRHPLENDRPAADPDAILYLDGLGHKSDAGEFMLVRIHDEHIACDLAVAADFDRPSRDYLGVA